MEKPRKSVMPPRSKASASAKQNNSKAAQPAPPKKGVAPTKTSALGPKMIVNSVTRRDEMPGANYHRPLLSGLKAAIAAGALNTMRQILSDYTGENLNEYSDNDIEIVANNLAAGDRERPHGERVTHDVQARRQDSGPAFVAEGTSFTGHPMSVRAISTPHGPGLRLEGRQALCAVKTTALTHDMFDYTGFPAGGDVNSIRLTPDVLNSRLAHFGEMFCRWRPNHWHIMYVPACPTSQVGQFALGVLDDAAISTFNSNLDFCTIMETRVSTMTPFWKSTSLKWEHYDEDWLYVEGTSTAGIRMSADSILFGYPSAVGAATTTMGTLWLCYSADFASPSPSYALNVMEQLRSEYGRDVLNEILKLLSGSPKTVLSLAREAGDLPEEHTEVGRAKPPLRTLLKPPPSKGKEPPQYHNGAARPRTA